MKIMDKNIKRIMIRMHEMEQKNFQDMSVNRVPSDFLHNRKRYLFARIRKRARLKEAKICAVIIVGFLLGLLLLQFSHFINNKLNISYIKNE